MKRVSVKFSIVAALLIILTLAAPVGAWDTAHHNKVTEFSLANKTLPSIWNNTTSRNNIIDSADDPDSWLVYCKIHEPITLKACTAYWAVPTPFFSGFRVSSKEFGYATHFLGDAGQPYHAKYVLNGGHFAFEEYASRYSLYDCNSVQSAMKNASTTAVPNSGNLGADVVTHVGNLLAYSGSKYDSLKPLVEKAMVTGPATVSVCGNAYSLSTGQLGMNEAKLTVSEQTALRDLTLDLLKKTASYLKGLIDIEGIRNKDLDP